ncbi:MAG: NAD(P)H-dependent oxidoreductase [Oscillospiraceae bacterium]|nr:NAD(P)H-dependent oxidoreductase [Oscillospiraceae bacterium]
MDKKSIGIVIGSLRQDSFCKKIAAYLSGLLSESFTVAFMDIGSLSMYNQDLDNDSDAPVEWKRFRREIKEQDAVLFITPEYNRSMPPVLKNALDIASRPMSENAWSGKPGAVISVTPGKTGGFGVNQHLRQSATCLNIYMMQKPEAYIGGVADLVDANGVSDPGIQEFLREFAAAFADWINRFTA